MTDTTKEKGGRRANLINFAIKIRTAKPPPLLLKKKKNIHPPPLLPYLEYDLN